MKKSEGNGHALQHASAEVKGDREIVMEAVKKDGDALKHASAALQGCTTLALTALQAPKRAGHQPTDLLLYLPESVRSDRACVMAAFDYEDEWAKGLPPEPGLLRCVSPELRADPSVVMAAVRMNGNNLLFAAPALRGNREIVIRAIRSSNATLGELLSLDGDDDDGAANALQISGDLHIMTAAISFRKFTFTWNDHRQQGVYRRNLDLAAPYLRDGALKAHVNALVREAFNVPDYTFASTFLFRFRGRLAPELLRRVAGFAGVRCGARWALLRRAAFHLGVSLFLRGHATGARSQLPKKRPGLSRSQRRRHLLGSLSQPREVAGAVGINSVSTPQVSDAALAIISAGGGSLDGYILQAADNINTARHDLHRHFPGDEFIADRRNILLAISRRT